MPQTQLSQRLGADNSIFDLKETKQVKQSAFDFSRKTFTTMDLGALVPLETIHLYPKDRVRLNIRYLLETFPLEVPTMTNYFIRTHWYFVKNSSLWKGWNTFITKGRSGNIDLEIPSITSSDYLAADVNGNQFSCPNSLGSYLGLPSVYYDADASHASYLGYIADSGKSTTGFHLPSKFSVLDLFAYQKIVRSNYLSPNLLQDNHIWFPEDMQNEWWLDYSASNLHGAYYQPEGATYPAGTDADPIISSTVPSVNDNVVDIRQLRYGLYGNDYFTSAKPWLVRGAETEIDVESSSVEKVFAQFYDYMQGAGSSIDNGVFFERGTRLIEGQQVPSYAFGISDKKVFGDSVKDTVFTNLGSGSSALSVYPYNAPLSYPSSSSSDFVRALGVDLSNVKFGAKLSANTIRNLLAKSVYQERGTLSNGNYNRLIQAHWNHKPHSPEFEPIYIGGTSDMVSFGSVVQSSSSVSGSPLGSRAGQGSASGGGNVLDFVADDYGIIIGIMFISPEVAYHGGVERHWTELTHDEQFQPEFANLGYQPILNQEICATGTDSIDKDLFGYQTRFAYLKTRMNRVSGLFELNSMQNSTFGPYNQIRRFTSVPSLSEQFVTLSPDNLDRSFLSFTNLPAFKVQFASDVRLIRSLPYQSTPETFGF